MCPASASPCKCRDHGRISLLRSWQCADDVVQLVLTHFPECLEATNAVWLILARRCSDVASEKALDKAQLAVREWSSMEEALAQELLRCEGARQRRKERRVSLHLINQYI
jgi:hypothetical protein